MEKQFNIKLSKEEREALDMAFDKSGMRSRADLLRFLLTEYIQEWYQKNEKESAKTITMCSSPKDGVQISINNSVALTLTQDEAFFVVCDALMALDRPELAVVCQRASMFMAGYEEGGFDKYNELMEGF